MGSGPGSSTPPCSCAQGPASSPRDGRRRGREKPYALDTDQPGLSSHPTDGKMEAQARAKGARGHRDQLSHFTDKETEPGMECCAT